ncbi:hypothetical protein BT67DRAFT_241937 [Trichocladium antarcticum]|uniref:MYB transcription factor n=1 Tax=Trichocladium antarcticum TaxID=1450529 RepID=A0AAN6UCD2_9PEZI|nr:hypothetical protein BT67DRAFT_241937 [Trichocladium antarcticum]
MATIEPRLIHLLNNSQTPDLPPIQHLPLGVGPGQPLSLPPLGPELTGSSHRDDRPAPTQIAPLRTVNDAHIAKSAARVDDLTSSIRPLQLLLGEPEPAAHAIPLHKIVDDVPESPEDVSNKKRHRVLNAKEDFVQLPKLPKKRKSAQQIVPPIIAGLHEPPPDAAVFPPINSASFDDNEAFGLGAWKDFSSGPEDRSTQPPVIDVGSNNTPKPKRRAMKPRKKWSEEETNNLLRGVSRYGVGRWTTILEDPEFEFNGRNAGDLKDRFRTCCPEELRRTTVGERPGDEDAGSPTTLEETTRPNHGLQLENILIPNDGDPAGNDEASPSAFLDPDAQPRRRKSRAHRKKMEDLAELGIHGPFEKSHRRKRRPFTKQDDQEILDGLEQYGPSWSRIQRDPKYHLSARQPTDLRDRVRNKYPDIYSRIEKANLQAKEAARGKGGILEPSPNLVAENSHSSLIPISLEPQLNRSGSKEDMSRRTTTSAAYESTECLPGLADIFDTNEPIGTSFLGSAPEMDISHLLLDDAHVPSEHLGFGGHDAASHGILPAGGRPDPRLAQDR